MKPPAGLHKGGRDLWSEVTAAHDLDAIQRVQLEEACRAKDRIDQLDKVLQGKVETWCEIVTDQDGAPISLQINSVLDKANSTANLMKQLLAALRLPDEKTGKRPQRRGPRGAQKPSVPGGAKVSSLERARLAKTGA